MTWRTTLSDFCSNKATACKIDLVEVSVKSPKRMFSLPRSLSSLRPPLLFSYSKSASNDKDADTADVQKTSDDDPISNTFPTEKPHSKDTGSHGNDMQLIKRERGATFRATQLSQSAFLLRRAGELVEEGNKEAAEEFYRVGTSFLQ